MCRVIPVFPQPLAGGALGRSALVSLLSLQGEPLTVPQCEELLASLPRMEGVDGAVDIDRYATMLVPPFF